MKWYQADRKLLYVTMSWAPIGSWSFWRYDPLIPGSTGTEDIYEYEIHAGTKLRMISKFNTQYAASSYHHINSLA